MNLTFLNRRKFLGSMCLIIGEKCMAQTNTTPCPTKEQPVGKVNLIRLRPYHPTYVIATCSSMVCRI